VVEAAALGWKHPIVQHRVADDAAVLDGHVLVASAGDTYAATVSTGGVAGDDGVVVEWSRTALCRQSGRGCGFEPAALRTPLRPRRMVWFPGERARGDGHLDVVAKDIESARPTGRPCCSRTMCS